MRPSLSETLKTGIKKRMFLNKLVLKVDLRPEC